jgi:phospholipid transport system substrate-binding protein
MKAVSRASLLSCACVALWLLIQPGFAAGSGPSEVVRGFYQTLLDNMRNGPSLGQQGRSAQLAPVVPRVFDIPYMTQLAIGPAWTTLPEPQRQQVMQAFERYVTAVYADRFDTYSGERLEVVGEQPTTYGTVVKTRIIKASGEPVTLNYLMINGGGGGPQIGDVYLDGTISELAARRADFSSTLRTQGVPGLITALNNKALTLAPPRSSLSGSSSSR